MSSIDSFRTKNILPEHGKFSVDFFKPFFKEHRDTFFGEKQISEKQMLLLAFAVERAKQTRLFSAIKFMDALGLVLPVTDTESIRNWIQKKTAGITVSSETLREAGFKEMETSYLLSLMAPAPRGGHDRSKKTESACHCAKETCAAAPERAHIYWRLQ